jgi:hypothetical protein
MGGRGESMNAGQPRAFADTAGYIRAADGSERNLAEMAGYFRMAAERFTETGSPLYAALARGCADDVDLLALAAHAPNGQLPFYLLFGAVQFLLLQRPDQPLAGFYSLRPALIEFEQAFGAFRAFCLEHIREIVAIMRSRTVQMTTVSRAALLVPSMALVADEAGEPLSLIEVGCSAGLLSLFDHYRYDFGAAGCVGNSQGIAISGAGFRGLSRVSKVLPRIGRRWGIDLCPIDPNDVAERRWIESLIPPDWSDERRQLAAALDYRARTPLETITGDALAEVPKLLADIPGPVCIFHAHCLYQWPPDKRDVFDEMLRNLGQVRTLHRLSMEYTDPRWAALIEPRQPDPRLPFELIYSVFRDGRQSARRLACYDGYGRDVAWLGG